ncbi:hypothetical protein FZP57_07850 [Methanothermobacter sp. THM-1]|jgi:hypothetical protein|uniref:hypothetical protein n=1 Tax=Methanothermobacter sp. THM-1 TaxID=2606911 RepID=UPI0013677689|nr:hypothetical protein [Methanothermobacter sp. THM-1]QHN06948.1 hypothetical protein FZP57_07850 [Methanothermobacter sp. THM-1]
MIKGDVQTTIRINKHVHQFLREFCETCRFYGRKDVTITRIVNDAILYYLDHNSLYRTYDLRVYDENGEREKPES